MEDQSILEIIESIKNSQYEGDWWINISGVIKEGIKRGEADVQTGRIHSSKNFGKKSTAVEKKNINVNPV